MTDKVDDLAIDCSKLRQRFPDSSAVSLFDQLIEQRAVRSRHGFAIPALRLPSGLASEIGLLGSGPFSLLALPFIELTSPRCLGVVLIWDGAVTTKASDQDAGRLLRNIIRVVSGIGGPPREGLDYGLRLT